MAKPVGETGPPTGGIASQELAVAVGLAVKAARARTGMTMVELGSRAGVTQAFLSQLEKGRSMPSLLTLHRIAQALGVGAQTLLPETDYGIISLVRANEGHEYERSDEPGAILERFLASGRRLMEPGEVRAAPGSTSGEYVEHNGEEFVYVLAGTIRIDLQAVRTEVLERGDCLYFPASIPHRWEVIGDSEASFLVVATPSSF